MARYAPEFEDRLIEAQDEFVWETPEHERYDRGSRWYLIMGGIALLFVGYAVWTANYLFALIILLLAMTILLIGNEKPRKILIQVGHHGLVIDGRFISFDELRNFAIIYQPPMVKTLYLYPKNSILPRYRIYLGDQDPVGIREHLRQYVMEDFDMRDEHASDILGRLLRL